MKTSICALSGPPGLRRSHDLKRILARGITLGLITCSAKSAFTQNWTTTTAPVANWVSVASSADGNKLAALVQNGAAVYVSTNAGNTWTLSSPPSGGVLGSSIACSADGSILFVAGSTQIYRSTNSGSAWSLLTGSPIANWTAIASSADGTQVAGTSSFRRGSPVDIFISRDGGTTWASTAAPNAPWRAIASSADGSKLVGVDVTADAIYTSSDSGNTWAQNTPPLQAFSAVASSADGKQLIAASENISPGKGPVFVSTNSGLNWIQTSAPITNWAAVASSADGRTLIAAGGGSSSQGQLYLSTDSGATWNQTNALLTHWTSVAISADGSQLVATDYGGHIYTLHLSPPTQSPSLHISALAGNVQISWPVPSAPFVLQQNVDLGSSNWTDVTAAPVLDTANLHNEVTVANAVGSAFFRLVSPRDSTQPIANVLRGPWQTLVVDTLFTPTFNADGTFTATIQPPSGVIATDSGTWALTPPLVPSGFTNPQRHLTLTNTQSTILLSGDVLLINPDQLLMTSATDSLSATTFVPQLVISKRTP